MPEHVLNEADIVIAGYLTILLVESGKDIGDNERVAKPLDGLFSVYEGEDQIRYMRSAPLQQLNGRAPVVPVGNIVGGSSSINFMMYNTAAASDFDDWNTPGWSFEELAPYIRKSERFEADGQISDVHGIDGRMPVSHGGYRNPYAGAYFEAMQQVRGIPKVDDLVDYRVGHGCGYLPKFISRKGVRSNAAHSYLYQPGHLDSSSKVRILSGYTVASVVLDHGTATGLEVVDSPSGPLNDASAKRRQVVKARKMVILSAGTFGSPMILERSGIGSRDLLEGLGIEVQVDLPGVGAEYQDHELTICSYQLSDEAETLDDYARGGSARERADAEWAKTGQGMTATNGFDYGYKVRPTEDDIKEMGPEFERHWRTVAGDKPDKPLYSGPMVNYFMGPTARPATGKYFSMGAFLNYPAGRGHVHITNPEPFVPADFDAGLLVHPADFPPHVWAYKWQREVARRMPHYLGEHPDSHPVFPEGSKAGLERLITPRSGLVPPLRYTPEDDEAIHDWVRRTVGTAYHSISTCQMKAREAGGVVDPGLRVHGVKGLRIADLSICPANLGTNTTTVALIVGERAADIFLHDLAEI